MSNKRYQPLGNRVLIKREEAAETTTGGLYIPETAKKSSDRGVIVAVGPGGIELATGLRVPVSLKVGQTVLFNRAGGIDVVVAGEKLVLMNEPEIFAVELDVGEELTAPAPQEASTKARRQRSDAGVKRGPRNQVKVETAAQSVPPTQEAV